MITIRPYQEKDHDACENICLVTASERLRSTEEYREATLDTWCHYYIECEPQNCFVAADEEDEAIGYILCACDFDKWKKDYAKKYVNCSDNPITVEFGKDSIEGTEPFAKEYPAHMHIDILPLYQREGVGGRLLGALLEHLRGLGISGLCLGCSDTNEKGLHFYRKSGFTEVAAFEGEVVFGMKL